MNSTRTAGKSSDDIINELFNSLNLPASDKTLDKSKKSLIDTKSFHNFEDSCGLLSGSGSDSFDSTDQEIDKLLEDITDVTDENFKVENISSEVDPKDKKKKKKLKKANSSKSKKKRKKSHKSKKLSDSEGERERNKKSVSPGFPSDKEKSVVIKKKKYRSISRSRSRSRSYTRRSRSKSKTNHSYSSSSRYFRSRSRSVSKSKSQKSQNKKSREKDFERSLSKSPLPKSKKDSKHRSKSPSKKGKEEVDSLKLASQKTDKPKFKPINGTFQSDHVPPLKSESLSEFDKSKNNKTMSKGSNEKKPKLEENCFNGNSADVSIAKDEALKEDLKPKEENLLTAFKKARKESTATDKENSKDKKSNRSRSRSKSKRRSRSGSRSKNKRKRSRSVSRSKDKYKKQVGSKDKYKKRSRSRSRSRRSPSRNRYRGKRSRSRSGSRSRQYNKNRRPGKRSPSKDRRKSPDCVDSLRDKATRKRLLDVARKNAVYLMKNNCLPSNIEKETVRATGKSVEELTSFCRKLVSKDYSDPELSDPSLSPDDREPSSFSATRHHPFAVKDSKPIMMNIRNAPMLPVKSNAERLADTSKLREQFPVSSGSEHRNVESEWVPVEKDESAEKQTVFPESRFHQQNVDITQLVTTRLNAMKRLQANPTDRDAMKELTSAQKDMQNWALSKQMPGQFTGSTGAKILSAEELTSGYQAWAKKDQFKTSKAVRSHFGMKMLQKMGWTPGNGLGKNNDGQLEPLLLDVKMDKKGLAAQKEFISKRAPIPLMRSLSGKHPVTALAEICVKRKWNPPEYEIVFDSGPDHKKHFLMIVHVNKETFKSACVASTKKIAKANAAAACLQAMGLIPQSSGPIKSQETLHTTATEGGATTTDQTASQPQEGAQPAADQPQDGVQEDAQQAAVVQYAADGTQDPMAQYAVDGSQGQYVDDGQGGMIQYNADGTQIIAQYNADGTQVVPQYAVDGTQYAADGTQELGQYGPEEPTQAVAQYSAEDPNNVHYAVDGTHDASQYNADGTQAMPQYGPDATVLPQYAADGSQYAAENVEGTAHYAANGSEAVSHYSTNDSQSMAQYGHSAASQYQADGTQASHAQYSNDMQAYQQYSSTDNTQAYQQQQQQQYSNSRSGSFNFPQPPRSLTHGIADDSGNVTSAAVNGNASHRERSAGSDSHTGNSYDSSTAYGNNASSYNQMQYYGGSYQGSQQY